MKVAIALILLGVSLAVVTADTACYSTDAPRCAEDASLDMCTDATFGSLVTSYCPVLCGVCQACTDAPRCAEDASLEMCTDATYGSLVTSYCPVFCGVCQEPKKRASSVLELLLRQF